MSKINMFKMDVWPFGHSYRVTTLSTLDGRTDELILIIRKTLIKKIKYLDHKNCLKRYRSFIKVINFVFVFDIENKLDRIIP